MCVLVCVCEVVCVKVCVIEVHYSRLAGELIMYVFNSMDLWELR